MNSDKPSIVKLNSLLDKILKYDLPSLTERELSFLKSFSCYDEDDFFIKYTNQESEEVFEDFDGYFRFEYIDTSYTPYSKLIHGRLYVPDLKLKNDIITGILSGYIIVSNEGQIILNFKKKKWDVFDFCNEIECELDIFIDSVVKQIDEKRGFKI